MRSIMRKQFAVQYRDWCAQLAFMAGAWAVGILAHGIVHAAVKNLDVTAEAGTIAAVIAGGILLFCVTMNQTVSYFNLEITLGLTRKQFLISYYAVCAAGSAAAGGFLCLLYAAERALNRFFYPGCSDALPGFGSELRWSVPLYLLVLLCAVFLGALRLRFGKRMQIPIWVTWMVCWIVGPKILTAVEEQPHSVFGRIGRALLQALAWFPARAWAVLLAALVILLAAVTCLILRRQQVT